MPSRQIALDVTDSSPDSSSRSRRVPTQERSRRKVVGILDAAASLVVERGVAGLSTREIAEVAQVPVATLYQYFSDKEAVLLALAERDMAEMDQQLAADVTGVAEPTVAVLVETAMRSFLKVYARRRAFVEIYLRGRGNPSVHEFGRRHNERIAATLHAYAHDRGLARPELTFAVTLFAVEIGDRALQLAYEHDAEGDDSLIGEGITMLTAYLERYATAAGLGRRDP